MQINIETEFVQVLYRYDFFGQFMRQVRSVVHGEYGVFSIVIALQVGEGIVGCPCSPST